MRGPFFARWTTDYDCGYEIGLWYVVRDTPFDITKLKLKRRYEITKGKKNFEVRRIDDLKYVEGLFNIQNCVLKS